jgi:DNA mismatch endonuclease (patch repair protein)
MLGNRSRDTRPEMVVRSLVHRAGLRFWVARRPCKLVRGAADLVFPRTQVAVYVDGCFWHKCSSHFVLPKTNVDYWRDKIDGNAARDRATRATLEAAGWTVLRFWEHEDPTDVAERIISTVRTLRE